MDEFAENKITQMLQKAKLGDKESEALMVKNNLGLVWSIVKRFNNRGHELEDLYQIGCIGLIKAIKKFDNSFNVKFSTYAVPMIIGEIKRFIRDDGIIKVSRSLKDISSKVKYIKESLLKELGREPTINEISKSLNISPEDIVVALEASYAPESLYKTVYENDNSSISLIDIIEDENDNEIKILDKLMLKQVLDSLDEKERQIIMFRYFRGMTQTQISKILGISQVQVSRIEKKITQEIKNKMIG